MNFLSYLITWLFSYLITWLLSYLDTQLLSYYAPPLRPEGPRRCPDRGNAGCALVFVSKFFEGSTVYFNYFRLLPGPDDHPMTGLLTWLF